MDSDKCASNRFGLLLLIVLCDVVNKINEFGNTLAFLVWEIMNQSRIKMERFQWIDLFLVKTFGLSEAAILKPSMFRKCTEYEKLEKKIEDKSVCLKDFCEALYTGCVPK